MVERKFTDDEIVKALECCSKDSMLNCRNCPYEESCNMGRSDMQKDALDLINRQKAEIADERARKELCVEVIKRLDKESKTARAEAIKELAERLKQYCAPGGDFGDPCGVLTVTDRWIDHLVQEMTGEDNGN